MPDPTSHAADMSPARPSAGQRRIERDRARHVHEARMRHATEMSNLDLADVVARALLAEFPDEMNCFDMALCAVRALAADGIVFARMGPTTTTDPDPDTAATG